MQTLVEECARELMEATPQLMQFFREEMRAGRTADLTVPQFRTLVWLRRHPGCGLGELAEGMGLSDPSMSKLVDVLVRRGLVSRIASREDRRRVILTLTAAGQDMLLAARKAAAQSFTQRLSGLSGNELSQVAATLRTLRALFQPRDAGYAPEAPARPADQ
jgi:DNA-binding MarR family transcriptional regulator